jgi:hypothetical protein
MNWSELTPEARGKIREQIYHVLRAEGRQTRNGLMHRLALDYATIGAALDAMLASGAVSYAVDDASGITFFAAVTASCVRSVSNSNSVSGSEESRHGSG